jgi:NADH-quinone oxidoreductase subunit E
MLTEEQRQKIQDMLKGVEKKRSIAVDALLLVQEYRGWVADEIHEVAELLEMDIAELDSIATFYSQIFRRPVGRHIIRLCDSVCCWVMGYGDLVKHLTETLGIGLGETTKDGLFTLLPVACLGACEQAPAVMVDETLHGFVTVEHIDKILEEYR